MRKIDRIIYCRKGRRDKTLNEKDVIVLYKEPETMYEFLQDTPKSFLRKMFANVFLSGQHYSNEKDIDFINDKIEEWLDKPCFYDTGTDVIVGCDPDFKRSN